MLPLWFPDQVSQENRVQFLSENGPTGRWGAPNQARPKTAPNPKVPDVFAWKSSSAADVQSVSRIRDEPFDLDKKCCH